MRTLLALSAVAVAALPVIPLAAQAPAPEPVIPGIEVFLEHPPAAVVGRRIGLITNQTGVDRRGRSTIDLLRRCPQVTLVALFAAEHGIRGVVGPGDTVTTAVDSASGLPVFSIYGATFAPTPEMLDGIDALVYDMQDLGVRQYTTESTLLLAMRAAARNGIPFVVLDRPDPATGEIVEGNVLDPRFASFIGIGPVASRHGLTVGELARFYDATLSVGATLIVVPMRGWRRGMWLEDTGLPWVKTSPNIHRPETAVHYPGTVFLEATNLSEGRGTSRPFEQTGAPWLRAGEVVRVLDSLRLPGVRFDTVRIPIAPNAFKYGGQTVPGIRLVVTDRRRYRPIRTTLLLIDAVRRLHPDDFRWLAPDSSDGRVWQALERHAGTDELRKAYEAGTLPELLDRWDAQAAAFEKARRPYLLYR